MGVIMNIKKIAIIEIDKPKNKKELFWEDLFDFGKGLLFVGICSVFIYLLIYIYDVIIY